MNKVIVVGHPHSEYRNVEKLLYDCGVNPAQPSQQEGISPTEIGSILCKAHGVAPLDRLTDGEEIKQISVGAVWNGMILDLFRGNLEQPLWGWSDPQALYFLDYWKQIDPQLMFVLVYNHPRTILSQDPNCTQNLTSTRLEQLISQWHIYNMALLHFFHRNKDRSLLVHAQQVSTSAKNYVQQLQTRIRCSYNTAVDLLLTPPNVNDFEREQLSPQRQLPSTSMDNQLRLQTGDNYRENPLKHFLAGELLGHYPKAGQLYEDMQAIANLPADDNDSSLHSFAAWQIMSELYVQSEKLQKQTLEQQEQVNILKESNQILTKQNQKSSEEKNKKIQELEAEQKASSEKQKQIDYLKTQLKKRQQQNDNAKELQEENGLLLLQLHQVQEELEHYFIQYQELNSHQQPVYTGAAERLKKGLPYQLGAIMIKRSRKLWLLPFSPISLIRFTRQYRTEQQELSQDLPPLTEYNDFHEAEKVQKHLSYRLGITWLKHIQKPWGWIIMPFALFNANRAFRNYRKEKGAK